jgi:hypothetical protein
VRDYRKANVGEPPDSKTRRLPEPQSHQFAQEKSMRRFRALLMLLAALVMAALPSAAPAQLISITIEPPVLPVYVQPPIPSPGYIWTPGYWAYGPDGYFWVPGTWVQPPRVGVLWTPGYWGWNDGVYVFNAGYWGPTIGFYGGVNYGFGYGGVGYEGGYWSGGVLMYNRSVSNFGSVNITNVYNKTVINNTTVNNVSFNGGPRGIKAVATPQELAAAKQEHIPPTAVQAQHQAAASTNKELLHSVNHGNPSVAATSKAGEFKGPGVVAAHTGATGGLEKTGSEKTGLEKTGLEKKPPGTPGGPPNARTNTLATNPPGNLPKGTGGGAGQTNIPKEPGGELKATGRPVGEPRGNIANVERNLKPANPVGAPPKNVRPPPHVAATPGGPPHPPPGAGPHPPGPAAGGKKEKEQHP